MMGTLPLDITGFNYLADINTGMRRTAADTQAIECGGVDIVTVDTNGIDVTGAIKQNGISIAIPIGLGPLPWSGLSAPAGWLLCAGQSLSRTAYADLWAFAQAEIAGGNTLFTNGDGSTTFTIVDMRGRITAGKDNMGGSAAGRLTSTTMSPDGNTLGASGGSQTQTISQSNLPSVNFNVSIPAGQGLHSHSFNDGGGNFVTTQGGGSNALNSGSSILAPTGLSINNNSLPAMVGTAASGGSGAALNTVQPSIVTNYIIFAGV